jgi:hypothetical protein
MSGVSIQEFGIRFVKACMAQYWGSCLFPLLFAAGLIWTVLRHRRQAEMIFLGYTVFLFLTVYNPYLVKVLVPALSFEVEYYRLIWLLPIIPGAAYYGVRLVFDRKHTWQKAACVLVLVALILVTGTPLSGVVENFALAENLYKVPDDLLDVCEAIHKDTDEESPKVVFDSGLNNIARQYDASLKLVINRDAALYRAGSQTIEKKDEDSVWYQRQKTILDVVDYEEDVSPEAFQEALSGTGADYLVVRVAMSKHDFLVENGCVPIAKTEGYVVYRCS